MSNRPLTVTEGLLCAVLAAAFTDLARGWHGFWHWWGLTIAVFCAVTAAATIVRHLVGEERMARLRGGDS